MENLLSNIAGSDNINIFINYLAPLFEDKGIVELLYGLYGKRSAVSNIPPFDSYVYDPEVRILPLPAYQGGWPHSKAHEIYKPLNGFHLHKQSGSDCLFVEKIDSDKWRLFTGSLYGKTPMKESPDGISWIPLQSGAAIVCHESGIIAAIKAIGF